MAPATNEISTGYFLVTFFDLLGQSDALREITSLPASNAETEAFLGRLRATVGEVLMVRKLFTDFFKAPITPDLSGVRPEMQEQFAAAMKRVPPIIYGLSDATVIAVPLFGDSVEDTCAAMNAVHDAIAAAGVVQLSLLAEGIPCRAGIDVGIATLIGNEEIYGPVLESAVNLETRVADGLRLAIGSGVTEYLESLSEIEASDPLETVIQEMAARCQRMVLSDTDGVLVLDFLGSVLKETFPGQLKPELYHRIFRFAEEHNRRFSGLGDERLASRYSRLCVYCQSRREVWSNSKD